jgi:hypothetical protein
VGENSSRTRRPRTQRDRVAVAATAELGCFAGVISAELPIGLDAALVIAGPRFAAPDFFGVYSLHLRKNWRRTPIRLEMTGWRKNTSMGHTYWALSQGHDGSASSGVCGFATNGYKPEWMTDDAPFLFLFCLRN